jgi:hypothetical protein
MEERRNPLLSLYGNKNYARRVHYRHAPINNLSRGLVKIFLKKFFKKGLTNVPKYGIIVTGEE